MLTCGGHMEVLEVRDKAAELKWVFRPGQARTADVLALAGQTVHSTGAPTADGTFEVVLSDGTRTRAYRREVVAE